MRDLIFNISVKCYISKLTISHLNAFVTTWLSKQKRFVTTYEM